MQALFTWKIHLGNIFIIKYILKYTEVFKFFLRNEPVLSRLLI